MNENLLFLNENLSFLNDDFDFFCVALLCSIPKNNMSFVVNHQDNAVWATFTFVKALGVKITEMSLEESLKAHPEYPSLLATSDVLQNFKIENAALRLNIIQLKEVPTPFMVFLKTDGGKFAVVRSVKEESIEWVQAQNNSIIKESLLSFSTKWDGIVLMAEPSELSGEKDFRSQRKTEILHTAKRPILLGGLILVIAYILYSYFSANWVSNALLVSKITGSIICSLLLWQSIDSRNPFIQSLCQAGSKINCSSILNSKSAQITTWLNWSDVGFMYFIGGVLSLIVLKDEALFFLKITSFLALPYCVWSLYYQGFIAKQWCSLCLIVQLLFLIEAIVCWYSPVMNIHFDFFATSIVYLIPALFLLFLKPFFTLSQQVKPLKKELNKFKNNPNLFFSLLHTQEQMPPIDDLKTIDMGSKESEHCLVMVTNPLCQPCARSHEMIEKMIENIPNLGCKIIFTATNDKADLRGEIARKILSLSENAQSLALQTWYQSENTNIVNWSKTLPEPIHDQTESILEKHMAWCNKAEISATPTIYLNQYRLPEIYTLHDLELLMRFLPTLGFANQK